MNKSKTLFLIFFITLISFSSTNSKAINYEKLYQDNNIELLKLDYVIRFKIVNTEKNFRIEILENNKIVEYFKMNFTNHYSYFLNYGNNSLKVMIDKNIILDDYFYRENEDIGFNLNNIIFLIVIIVIGYFSFRFINDYYIKDMQFKIGVNKIEKDNKFNIRNDSNNKL